MARAFDLIRSADFTDPEYAALYATINGSVGNGRAGYSPVTSKEFIHANILSKGFLERVLNRKAFDRISPDALRDKFRHESMAVSHVPVFADVGDIRVVKSPRGSRRDWLIAELESDDLTDEKQQYLDILGGIAGRPFSMGTSLPRLVLATFYDETIDGPGLDNIAQAIGETVLLKPVEFI